MSANRVIGCGPEIPWHIPGEQLRFKKVTMGYSLIMGRKTFESIGSPLPGRRNIIITRNNDYRADGCDIVFSLDEALDLCKNEEKVFVIGGEQIFKKALPHTQTIILTTIQREVDGDVFFPEFDGFIRTHTEEIGGPDPYKIETFKREQV